MKLLAAILACCAIVIALLAILPAASAITIGISVFVLWCTVLGHFLKIRDNQIILHKAMLQALKDRT